MDEGYHPNADPPAARLATGGRFAPGVDTREQLVNSGDVGRITEVSVPKDMITSLLAIMIDFDPHLYAPGRLPAGATDSPGGLYEKFVGPMLAHHPVYDAAEVRDSGRGLHVIIRLDPPVMFTSEGVRELWTGAVKAVQKALPGDPDAPGITAMTRPVGSVNSKTGRTVTVLKNGQPVAPARVLKLVDDLRSRPFATVAGLLVGEKVNPCPVCRAPNTRLGVNPRRGLCYDGCGKVTLDDLFGIFYAASAAGGE